MTPASALLMLASLASLSGGSVGDLSQGLTAVVFLSARCPCSEAHEPALRRLVGEYPTVRFVGVHSNTDEGEAEARAHFKAAEFPFPVVQDTDARVADAFGALKTPHAFVVRGGEVIYQGGVDDSRGAGVDAKPLLGSALAAVVAGRLPESGKTRTLGCVIKRP